MLSEVESDIAAGRAAVVASGPPPSGGASAGVVDLAATVAAGEQVATSVRAEINAGRPDPFRLLGRLEQANGRLDAALATIRDAATRADRARTTLDQTIPAERAEIEAVGTFITTRRGCGRKRHQRCQWQLWLGRPDAGRVRRPWDPGATPVVAWPVTRQPGPRRQSRLSASSMARWNVGYA